MNLKRAAQRKLKKSGGFTLVEMLIVVAIIAILVVVSIPMVSSSLDKARTATDDANMRAAKAAAMITYMTNNETTEKTYAYNSDGTVTDIASSGATIAAGNKGYDYGQSKKNEKGYVQVVINADGVVDSSTDKTKWVLPTATGTP